MHAVNPVNDTALTSDAHEMAVVPPVPIGLMRQKSPPIQRLALTANWHLFRALPAFDGVVSIINSSILDTVDESVKIFVANVVGKFGVVITAIARRNDEFDKRVAAIVLRVDVFSGETATRTERRR